MRSPVKITTPFPTVMETAKRLGVSKKDALMLSKLADEIHRVEKLLRAGLRGSSKRKGHSVQKPTSGAQKQNPAKRVLKLRAAKSH